MAAKLVRDALPFVKVKILGITIKLPIRDADSYQTPELPEIPMVRSWEGPWNRRINDLPVDEDRTARLVEYNGPVKNTVRTKVWDGSVSGQPYNVLKGNEKPVDVLNASKPPTINKNDQVVLPTEKIPLPDVILRQGDPMGSSDMHVTIINPALREVWDMILFDQNFIGGPKWKAGYNGGGQGIYKYDLSKPYAGQKGTCAASVPKFVMVLGWDEVEAAIELDKPIDKALFVGMANYSPEKPTGFAQGTDGEWEGSPLRAGELLRLRPEVIERFPLKSPQRVIARALNDHGMFVGDKSTHDDPRGKGGSLTTTGDRRFAALEDMGLLLTDFEVVVQ